MPAFKENASFDWKTRLSLFRDLERVVHRVSQRHSKNCSADFACLQYGESGNRAPRAMLMRWLFRQEPQFYRSPLAQQRQ